MTADDSGLTAALLTLTQHAERLGQLETGVAANLQQCEMATEGLAGAIADLRTLVEQQGQLIEALSQLVAELVPPDDDDGPGYKPRPPVHWWKLERRRAAKGRRRTWPRGSSRFTGRTTATWPPGWAPAGRTTRCAWSASTSCPSCTASCTSSRSARHALLSAQAEYTTRILPAFAEQFRAETSKCTHRPEAASGSAWRGAR